MLDIKEGRGSTIIFTKGLLVSVQNNRPLVIINVYKKIV